MPALISKVMKIIFLWKKVCGEGKNPFRSKTIWTLILSATALLVSGNCGITIDPEWQVFIMAALGIAMRFISTNPIGFWEDTEQGDDDDSASVETIDACRENSKDTSRSV